MDRVSEDSRTDPWAAEWKERYEATLERDERFHYLLDHGQTGPSTAFACRR